MLPARLGRILLAGALLLALAGTPLAAENQIRSAEILSTEDGYVLNADIDLALTGRLEEAIRRGVSVYFTTELEISRPRWYWLDEEVVHRTLEYRLSYHAITRSYRLSVGSLHQSFETLEEAIRTMLRLRNWSVAERSALSPGQSYKVALRMALDTTQLPKPFLVTVIGSKDWNLATDWMRWTFLATAGEAR
ncbi:MAG: DUF4390 domain-containing protein [Rhodocyclaceae bacterium]|nr:DUF4390 domain-containing protein [Rhodocyclaceae bacterium]